MRVWTKNTICCEILRNFRKFSKNLLRKLRKMHYFRIFFEKFHKPCTKFLRVWTKKANCWKLWEKFRSFSKFFLRKLLKVHYFGIFFKKINKPSVKFLRVWTKNANCWEILRKFLINFKKSNSIENLIFYFYFFGNLLLKIEPSKITPFFYNIFSVSVGGGDFPLPPCLRPWHAYICNSRKKEIHLCSSL